MQEKNNSSFVMGIISIIVAFIFPLLSIIFGILGLALAILNQNESGLDYTTEKISLYCRDCAFCNFLSHVYLTTFGN